MTQKILFLRVGIDSGSGGTLGPVFRNDEFEYIPIPENDGRKSSRSVYYNRLKARYHTGTLEKFVPKKYQQAAVHHDPEFETFTYGDPGRNKRLQLLRLIKGDYLVFYAGLKPFDFKAPNRLYIIGYLTIDQVHEISECESWPPVKYEHLAKNAHIRRNSYDPGLVIAQGQANYSYLFKKAVPFSTEQYEVLPDITAIIGLTGSVMRAGAGRWVPENKVGDAIAWIEEIRKANT
jgi:hypothetical protein